LRAGILPPDNVRGVPLDMEQYLRLLGTARIPTDVRPFSVSFLELIVIAERL
jgi:hypothetical protein